MVIQSIRGIRLASHILFGVLLLLLTGAVWNNRSALVKRTKQWWCARSIQLLGIKVTLTGCPPTSSEHKGILFVSNHISWTDIPLIGGYLRLNFLSKAEVKNWPIIGTLASGVGTLFIERGAGKADKVAKQIADYLDEGRNVLFFPEGTTTDGQNVKPFHSKLLRAAEHTEVTLCPIAIHYRVKGRQDNPVAFIGEDEFTTHLWNLLTLPAIEANITFLPTRKVDSSDLQAIANASREEIAGVVQAHQQRLNTSTQWPDASTHDAPNDEAASF